MFGPDYVKETNDKITLIKERIKVSQDRQKSYADGRRKPLEFKVGDLVFLKISPMRKVMRFGKKGKLTPRYVGPYEIVERVRNLTYKLKLPEEMKGIHDVFHVSQLRKCVHDEAEILQAPSRVEIIPD